MNASLKLGFSALVLVVGIIIFIKYMASMKKGEKFGIVLITLFAVFWINEPDQVNTMFSTLVKYTWGVLKGFFGGFSTGEGGS